MDRKGFEINTISVQYIRTSINLRLNGIGPINLHQKATTASLDMN